MLLTGACLFVCNISQTKAQCPTNIAPALPGWTPNQVATYTIPGTNCVLTVTYCKRYCTDFPTVGENTYQTFITQIVATGDDCDDEEIDFLTIANAASHAVNLTAPAAPCDEYPWPKMTGIMPACWKNLGGGHFSGYGCAGQARCLKTVEYCTDGYSFFNERNVTYQLSGTPNCTVPIGGVIPVGECGLLPCGPNP